VLVTMSEKLSGAILLMVALVIILVMSMPSIVNEVKSHIVVYEGPCTFSTLQIVGAAISGTNLALACGDRTASVPYLRVLDYPTLPPLSKVQVPCKVYANGAGVCNFGAYQLVH